MGPGNLFARVMQWLASEVIVKGLANSPTFQRFAVRSSQQAKELSKSATDVMKNIAESENVSQLRKVSSFILCLAMIVRIRNCGCLCALLQIHVFMCSLPHV